MTVSEELETEPEEASAIQIETAKKHFGSLYQESMLKVVLYSIPALVFTISSVVLFVRSEEGFNFNGMSYMVPGYVSLLMIVAAIICWGLFFWLKVRSSHKQAELWRKSMESYENLVLSESKLKTEEEKKAASRRSLRRAQREMNKSIK